MGETLKAAALMIASALFGIIMAVVVFVVLDELPHIIHEVMR